MNLRKNTKSLALWGIIILLVALVVHFVQGRFRQDRPVMSFSDFVTQVERGKIRKVAIYPHELHAEFQDKNQYLVYTTKEHTLLLTKTLQTHGVNYSVQPPENSLPIIWMLSQLFVPVLLFGGLWFFVFRQMQSSNGRAMGFGRSKAKLSDPEKNRITFDDVEGVEGAKEDLQEVVSFLKEPEAFKKVGGVIPKGILLVGPPGTGKTLLARAVAGEASVPFFSISGSDFVEMFVGVGASRVRDLFVHAKQHAPCIVFIDEIDAVGRQRSVGMGGSHDEREQTLNQLLVEMDGFDPKEEVIIIAATNRMDVLDPALLRPGRFDRRINVDLPDLRGREAILRVHLRKIHQAADVNPAIIARGTPGFSGAELANLVNEAALLAARLGKNEADAKDFETSRDKILMGPERRSMVMTDDERTLTAYHEAGHAVVAYYSPDSDPIHKATILPRGSALGMVVRLPETDRVSVSRKRLMADLAVAMAGRLAEEILVGHDNITTGASSDFRFATRMAHNMVTQWGMSDAAGLICYAAHDNPEWPSMRPEHSPQTQALIEQEIRTLIDKACDRVKHIFTEHRKDLDLVAQALLARETLTGEEIRTLLTMKSLSSLTDASPQTSDDANAPTDMHTSVHCPSQIPQASDTTKEAQQLQEPSSEEESLCSMHHAFS